MRLGNDALPGAVNAVLEDVTERERKRERGIMSVLVCIEREKRGGEGKVYFVLRIAVRLSC